MEIAVRIEHTNLSRELTISDIDQLVEEANAYGFYGICVPPFWVKRAKREIGTRNIKLITVAGFPMGYNMTETKLDEINRALENGADEIDVVWNLTAFRTGLPWTKIEIAKCGKMVHDAAKILKVIIESALLSDDEIRSACKLCADAGADFVKTSTGVGAGGATAHHVALMRAELPASVGIKASGGIKSLDDALHLIEAGADRIGTSSSVHIMNQFTLLTNT